MQFLLNTLISALTIAAVAEIGKKSTFMAAILIAMPLTSILSMSFLFVRTGDAAKISDLCYGIIWLVVPTFGFFVLLPTLLKTGMNFWLSLFLSTTSLVIGYYGYNWLLRRFGIFL
ncbi:MAG: DUF3147 family protein [Oligoflexales bacterium]